MKLHRDIGISQPAAWHMLQRIRKAWESKEPLFAGPLEVDETYLGGKERNKHESKKFKAGRGTVGKSTIIGAKDHTGAAEQRETERCKIKGNISRDGARIYHLPGWFVLRKDPN